MNEKEERTKKIERGYREGEQMAREGNARERKERERKGIESKGATRRRKGIMCIP